MEQINTFDNQLSSGHSAVPFVMNLAYDTRPDGEMVYLLTYDLSGGLARQLSGPLLGKQIDAIWHTSILYYGKEYFFGPDGVTVTNYNDAAPPMGKPLAKIPLGISQIPLQLFDEYILNLASSTFRRGTYDLFYHNCNNFSNEVAQFLTGKGVPEEILNLPSEFLSTEFGRLLASLHNPSGNSVNQATPGRPNIPDLSQLFSPELIQQTSNLFPQQQVSGPEIAKMSDSQVEKSEKKQNSGDEAHLNQPSVGGEELEDIKPKRKAPKYSDPPLAYRDVDGVSACKKIMDLVGPTLSEEERRLLEDWADYLKTEGDAWKLDDEHLSLITRLLNGEEGKFPPNVPLLTLEILQTAALKDDFVLVLHGDRKNHRLMSYIYKIENLTLAEQEEIAKLLCNFCSQPCSFDWLMYISEWSEPDETPASNSRVTTRVAVHTLLNDKLTTLQRVGVNLIFNLSLRELFEESATELATAVLQYLHGNIEEELVFLCLTSLLRFMAISINEVPALTTMLGPDLEKFKGVSSRVDDLIGQITTKVAALSVKKTESED